MHFVVVNLEAYQRISSKLKLGIIGDEYTVTSTLQSSKSVQTLGDNDATGQVKTGEPIIILWIVFQTSFGTLHWVACWRFVSLFK